MDKLNGFDIVCISSSNWDHPWGSKQQIMSRISLGNRVLYVEYQASFFHIYRPFLTKRLSAFFGRLNKITDNLYIYTPPLCLLPFGYYIRFINKINQKILAIFILKQTKKLNFKNPILWVYVPLAIDLIKYFKKSMVIYHCIADFIYEKSSQIRKNTIRIMEKELVNCADIIIAMTEGLRDRFKDLNPNVYYLPSAVDFEYFYKKFSEDSKSPEDLKGIKKPILGMVGYLDATVTDLKLLEYLCVSRPDWSLVLIGPIFRDNSFFKALRKRDNVYYLGGKRHADIPSYIKFFDVCLVPYKKNNFMQNVSPLKLYEYLALGKPVVSTNFFKKDTYDGLIETADTKEDFLTCIEKLLLEEDSGRIKRRLDLARENSWDKRLETVSRLISNKIV